MIEEVKKTFQFSVEFFEVDPLYVMEISEIVKKKGKWKPITITFLDIKNTAQRVFGITDGFDAGDRDFNRFTITTYDNTGVDAIDQYVITVKSMEVSYSKFSRTDENEHARKITVKIKPLNVDLKDVRTKY